MISVGVIGYGYWGPNLARVAAEGAGSALAAVADGFAEALARAGKRHPSAKLFQDWRDLVADPSIDAVMIATPVSTHFEMALAALKAGKHVFVEKPMTSTAAEAAILVDEALRRKLTLMVDHTFVYTGAVRKIDEVLKKGDLGDIYYYDSTRINLGLFQHDVNVIWDLAVHDLAILDFLLDEQPEVISASGAGHIGGSQENMAHVTLFYPGGALAHLNVSWLAPVKIRRTLLGGSQRMLVYDDLEPSEKIKIYDSGVDREISVAGERELRVSYRLGDMWAPRISVKEALLTEIEHFVECVSTAKTPITSGENGLQVVRMLECATASLRQRGNPIDLKTVRRAS